MLVEVPEVHLVTHPDRMIMVEKGLPPKRARAAALEAVRQARRRMPKLTGGAARGLQPLYGKGYFGLSWSTDVVWYQDHGTKPFTMRSLAGKVIPMWIDDPTGQERRDNPKAKTRTTESGKIQVLIFRRAARIGERKKVYRKDPKTGLKVLVSDSPAHYPGAPGRIGWRESKQPWTRPGKRPGAIHPGNIGVWWRHPGLKPRSFLNTSMTLAAQKNGLLAERVYVADRGWRNNVRLHGEEFR
ncbi:hypothetical protein FNV58_01425 (plasmid) [Streptomyces sp. RLB1-9]|uniref:hypothetical protein n=1 Tax=Streptomyces sp. RLB1-9 TaxID=2594454 RepID=UPI001161F0D8|nr:hypothetical protein [Streptomyces sp. RLB1-9]QDN95022.1 hypothetical protein FNV58_01425 [Streptomyces sp. RLB1-9]